MMGVSCSECGTFYYAKRVQKINLCSDACKQKRYRKSKRQKEAAKRETLTFDEYQAWGALEKFCGSVDCISELEAVLNGIKREQWVRALLLINLFSECAYKLGWEHGQAHLNAIE